MLEIQQLLSKRQQLLIKVVACKFLAFYRAMLRTDRGIATAKSSLCLALRDVEVSWSHRLEIFKNNFTSS